MDDPARTFPFWGHAGPISHGIKGTFEMQGMGFTETFVLMLWVCGQGETMSGLMYTGKCAKPREKISDF